MKFVPEVVSRKVGGLVLQGSKHSPTILFGVGIAGVVATAVLASRATLKLEGVLEEHASLLESVEQAKKVNPIQYTDDVAQKDTVYIYVKTIAKIGKLYILPLAVAAVTVGALAGSHNILSKRNVALTAAYAAVEKGFREYRDRVTSELGEDKDREFLYGGEKKDVVVKDEKGKDAVTYSVNVGQSPSVYARFFDETSRSWSKDPYANQFYINCQLNHANDKLRSRGHLFLNEVYDMLGLERTSAGQVVGWLYNHNDERDGYVDFGLSKDDEAHRAFVEGYERTVLLDFNVDGIIYDKI